MQKKFTLVPILKHPSINSRSNVHHTLKDTSRSYPKGSSTSSWESDFCLIKKRRKSLICHLSSEISVMCSWCEETYNTGTSVKVLSFNEFPFWNIYIKRLCFKLTTHQKTKHRCLQPIWNCCFISPQGWSLEASNGYSIAFKLP